MSVTPRVRTLSSTARPLVLSGAARPLVFAHRGGAALAPENTIAAFDRGLALGVDGIELDVRLSKDGEVVVHHDAALDRTTNATGPVAGYTATELARLDAGHRFQPHRGAPSDDEFPFRDRGIGVPTLVDVLTRYPDARFIVELKENAPALVARTIDAVRAARAVERTSLGSIYAGVLRTARVQEPRIRTGSSREETRWALYRSWIRWPLPRTGYREFQIPERSGQTVIVSPAFVASAHAAGIEVRVWTVDDPADMRRLLDWGVDALITDRPDLAVPIVSARS